MKSFLFFITFSTFFTFPTFSTVWAAEPLTLELKAKPGDVRRYALKTVADQRPALGATLEGTGVSTVFTGMIRLSVMKADPAGTFDVLSQFQKLDLQMKMGDQVLEAGELPMIAELKAHLLRQAPTFTVTKKGEFKSISLTAAELPAMPEGEAFFGEAPAQIKKTFESFLQHAYSWLPEKAVKIGEVWNRSMLSGLVTDPPLTFKMTHTLEGTEKVKGQECAKITTVIEVPHTELADGAYTFEGSGTVTTLFAIKAGATVSSKSILKVKFSGADQPATLESIVTTTLDLQ